MDEFNQFGLPKRYEMQFGLPQQYNAPTAVPNMGASTRMGIQAPYGDVMSGMDIGDTPAEGFDWGGLSKTLFGGEDAAGNKSTGAVTGGINAISGLGNLALGYKGYGLAKDELSFQKEQASINNQNQMTTLNNLMRAQADTRRKASGQGPTGEEYVSQYGIRV